MDLIGGIMHLRGIIAFLRGQHGHAGISVAVGAAAVSGAMLLSRAGQDQHLAHEATMSKARLLGKEANLSALAELKALLDIPKDRSLPKLGVYPVTNITRKTSPSAFHLVRRKAFPTGARKSLNKDGSISFFLPDMSVAKNHKRFASLMAGKTPAMVRRETKLRIIGRETDDLFSTIQSIDVEAVTRVKEKGGKRAVKTRARIPIALPKSDCRLRVDGKVVPPGSVDIRVGDQVKLNIVCDNVAHNPVIKVDGVVVSPPNRPGKPTRNDRVGGDDVPAIPKDVSTTKTGDTEIDISDSNGDPAGQGIKGDIAPPRTYRDPEVCKKYCQCAPHCANFASLETGVTTFEYAKKFQVDKYRIGCLGFKAKGKNDNTIWGYDPRNECKKGYIRDRDEIGCFATGTMVRMGNGQLRPVQHIRPGDLVWNPVRQQAFPVDEVIRGPEKQPLWMIRTAHHRLLVTADHPLPTSSGLRQAQQLRAGERVRTVDGWQTVTAAGQQPSPPEQAVWNLSLVGGADENDHMLEADGMVSGDFTLQKRLSVGSAVAGGR